MAIQRQKSWGWQVVVDVFAGGIGAGLFLTSYIMGVVFGPSQITEMGTIIGPLLVLLGIFFLLVEVGKPENSPRASGCPKTR